MRPWGLDCDRSIGFHPGGVRQPSWLASLLIAIAGNSHMRQAIVTTVNLTGRPYYSSKHESSSTCLLHLRDLAELRIRMPGLAVLGPFQPAQTAPASCALQGGPQIIRALGCVQDPSMPSRNVLGPKGGQRRALGILFSLGRDTCLHHLSRFCCWRIEQRDNPPDNPPVRPWPCY
ncbi:hypothetical protein B0T26DRAFT_383335 [Lasiosphaeria miniovina]|uniref:Uncharacterized protein n=1 Tax=Lasiosphaeria miniovina TaxID=1954250 RepID=A0AA40ADX7_9PEZI|nr:uncharacterized protein B0T26DRAFT_383335 [Lasiosphaeria miniovina]KAK0714017.1 hypothetical protein B0T26DRAFT_383335 [Lasiosphaeria miniovina]